MTPIPMKASEPATSTTKAATKSAFGSVRSKKNATTTKRMIARIRP